jgi:hypothetical protein
MNLTLMKCLAPTFSMTLVLAAVLGIVILSPMSALAGAGAGANSSAPLPDDIAGQPAKPRRFPTFCQIPARPRNVRTGKAFKEAVVAIRLSGVRLAVETAPGTFSLEHTDSFASAARAEAAPPPPITQPDDEQTQAFINKARALAHPPGPR